MDKLVIAHGGVDMDSSQVSMSSLESACAAGLRQLAGGGDCVRAVVAGVAVLEDDPQFNAGYGSVLNAVGTVEVDAAVVDGRTGRYGGIAAARGLRHPAAVAEVVLRSARASLLSGPGAEEFATKNDVRLEDLRTPEQVRVWEAFRAGEVVSKFTGRVVAPSTETVGCIAIRGLDLAATSSTGGVCGKPAGRIGDSAILGAGVWADAASAVLCSGDGEAMLSLQLARRVAERLAAGESASDAVAWAVRFAGEERGAVCAVVAARRRAAEVAAAHNGASFPVVASDGVSTWVVEPSRIEAWVR